METDKWPQSVCELGQPTSIGKARFIFVSVGVSLSQCNLTLCANASLARIQLTTIRLMMIKPDDDERKKKNPATTACSIYWHCSRSVTSLVGWIQYKNYMIDAKKEITWTLFFSDVCAFFYLRYGYRRKECIPKKNRSQNESFSRFKVASAAKTAKKWNK